MTMCVCSVKRPCSSTAKNQALGIDAEEASARMRHVLLARPADDVLHHHVQVVLELERSSDRVLVERGETQRAERQLVLVRRRLSGAERKPDHVERQVVARRHCQPDCGLATRVVCGAYLIAVDGQARDRRGDLDVGEDEAGGGGMQSPRSVALAQASWYLAAARSSDAGTRP
jgi:hypothetical protein